MVHEEPVDHPAAQPDRRRGGPRCGDYGGLNKARKPCGKPVIRGTKRCDMHSGKSRAKAKAEGAVAIAVATEVLRWGPGDVDVDPTEVMLRLVSQAFTRVRVYSQWLEEAVAAADRLRSLGALEDILVAPEHRLVFRGENAVMLPEHAARQTARQNLERIFMTGPVAALIGHTYTSTKDGDVFATGEAIRGLAKLEAEERDRAFRFSKDAAVAGLAAQAARGGASQVTNVLFVGSPAEREAALQTILASLAETAIKQRTIAGELAAAGTSLDQVTGAAPADDRPPPPIRRGET